MRMRIAQVSSIMTTWCTCMQVLRMRKYNHHVVRMRKYDQYVVCMRKYNHHMVHVLCRCWWKSCCGRQTWHGSTCSSGPSGAYPPTPGWRSCSHQSSSTGSIDRGYYEELATSPVIQSIGRQVHGDGGGWRVASLTLEKLQIRVRTKPGIRENSSVMSCVCFSLLVICGQACGGG